MKTKNFLDELIVNYMENGNKFVFIDYDYSYKMKYLDVKKYTNSMYDSIKIQNCNIYLIKKDSKENIEKKVHIGWFLIYKNCLKYKSIIFDRVETVIVSNFNPTYLNCLLEMLYSITYSKSCELFENKYDEIYYVQSISNRH